MTSDPLADTRRVDTPPGTTTASDAPSGPPSLVPSAWAARDRADRDPLEVAGTHSLGAAFGVVGGAMAGAVIGIAAGPVGSLAGVVAGAIAGAALGSGTMGAGPFAGKTHTADDVDAEARAMAAAEASIRPEEGVDVPSLRPGAPGNRRLAASRPRAGDDGGRPSAGLPRERLDD